MEEMAGLKALLTTFKIPEEDFHDFRQILFALLQNLKNHGTYPQLISKQIEIVFQDHHAGVHSAKWV